MKIKFNQIPKTTRLFLDYLYDFEKVQDFYRFAPFQWIDFTIQFDTLQNNFYHRDKIAEILIEQNKRFGTSQKTLKSIEKIKDKTTAVVFTGQQTGLFGGPLYTIYKALTAVNLAQHLTQHTPYTVLPFFWVEGEDHDFEEVRTANIIDKDNKLINLSWEPEKPFEGEIVGDMTLDQGIEQLIEKYRDNTFDTEFKDEVIDALKEHYKPGNTMVQAFAGWLTQLLGKHGLIMVDPSDHRLKKLAVPVYEKCLDRHRYEINQTLTKTNKELEKRGYHSQVGHRMDTLDFFYHEPRRLPFYREGETYFIKNTTLSFTKEELKGFIKDNYTRISPNVMLRPQVQDYLFPTVAYVAGPSEAAYYAQFKGIYDIFENPMPVIYPRRSITIMEKSIKKLIKKFDIEFKDVLGDKQELEKKIVSSLYPESLKQTIEETQANILQSLQKLEKESAAFNSNLIPVIKRLQGRMMKELSSTETRIANEIEKKDAIVRNQIEKLFVNVYPNGGLQERQLNILNYLYKYGFSLIDALRCLTCPLNEAEHTLWEIEPESFVCAGCCEEQ